MPPQPVRRELGRRLPQGIILAPSSEVSPRAGAGPSPLQAPLADPRPPPRWGPRAGCGLCSDQSRQALTLFLIFQNLPLTTQTSLGLPPCAWQRGMAFFIETHQGRPGRHGGSRGAFPTRGMGKSREGGREAGRRRAFSMVERALACQSGARGATGSRLASLSLSGPCKQTFLRRVPGGLGWAGGWGVPGIVAPSPALPPSLRVTTCNPRRQVQSGVEGVRGDLPGGTGAGRREEIGGSPARGEEEGGRSLADGGGPRGALEALGDQRRAAPAPRKLPSRRGGEAEAAARTYPVDLGQPPLLPGFEHAERLPPCRRQRAAGKRGARAHFPRAAARGPPGRTGGGRAGGRGHNVRGREPRDGAPGGEGRGGAAPTLKPVAGRDRHGERGAPAGSGLRGRGEGRAGGTGARFELPRRVAAAPRGGGKARAAGHTSPGLPSGPPPSPPAARPPASKRLLCGTPGPPPAPPLEGAERARAGPPVGTALPALPGTLASPVPAPAAGAPSSKRGRSQSAHLEELLGADAGAAAGRACATHRAVPLLPPPAPPASTHFEKGGVHPSPHF